MRKIGYYCWECEEYVGEMDEEGANGGKAEKGVNREMNGEERGMRL